MTAETAPTSDEVGHLLVAARRDPAVFTGVYDLQSRRVLAFFYRRVLCPHTASELMAETFAEAFASRRRYDPQRGSGTAWLFGIAGNLYRQWLRRSVVQDKARRRLGIQTPVLVDDDLEAIEQLIDLEPVREALTGSLAELSPKVRDAVLLRVALDLPYEEVAALLGCTVGTARVRVSRGLEVLRAGMEGLE